MQCLSFQWGLPGSVTRGVVGVGFGGRAEKGTLHSRQKSMGSVHAIGILCTQLDIGAITLKISRDLTP